MPRACRSPLLLLLPLLLWASTFVMLMACGTDDVGPRSKMVGGRCTIDNDCVKRCITGAEFPGGYCTVSCSADSDCPGGSACLASNGGICVATCKVLKDCDGYGPDYHCGRQTSQAGGTGVLACVAN